MGRYRFVDPEELRLPLSDGDYIDVKKVLNAGEYRKLLYDQFKDSDGGLVVIDHAKVGISKVIAYLLGWSFVGKHNQPEPYNLEQPEEIRRALIDNLDQDTYRELLAAINAHETEQDRVLDAKKNDRSTVTPSSAT
jgi:hypothetical protein